MPHSPSPRPNTRTEELLIELWSEILRVEAMRMLSRAERLGIHLPADATFEGCSLAELAALADCRTHAPAEEPPGSR
jgi:hypothetical protein